MNLKFSILLILALTSTVRGQSNWVTAEGFHGQVWTDVTAPRGLFLDDAGDILVLGRSRSEVLAIWDEEVGDGSVLVSKSKILDGAGLGLNHGLAHRDGFLYASSASTVYRWPYLAGSRELITESPTVIIRSIPTGGHTTRTLVIDESGQWMYVSVGSDTNVDQDSSRSRIVRFDISGEIVDGGFIFDSGEVFADGLRNEVGLAFDEHGVLWGVENGADQLVHPEFGDIHNGNPAEEMNRFDKPIGSHYGYPYCWSVYNLTGHPPGSQFAWPSFLDEGITDEFCNDPANNIPPTLAMPAHNAPMGIEFYDGRNCEVNGGFPCWARGDTIVPFRGSWNSDIKVGYRVGWIRRDRSLQDVDIIKDENAPGCGGFNPCFRPVNAIFDNQGHLIISAETTNEIIRVYYGMEPPRVVQK